VQNQGVMIIYVSYVGHTPWWLLLQVMHSAVWLPGTSSVTNEWRKSKCKERSEHGDSLGVNGIRGIID
jgi:hypothetical protein